MATGKTSKRETVLITGASSGIGEALAHCFAKAGCNLVLVARRAAKLRAVAKALAAAHGVRATIQPVDLRNPGAAKRLAAAMKRRGLRIDILVNNAGILEMGPFVRMPAARSQEMIAVNAAAATSMLAQFLPPMVRRGHGRVLNVCSAASFVPVPSMAIYAATKAFLLSLTESLAGELDGTGVTVSALCPGVTETHMKQVIEQANPKVAKLPGIAVSNVDDVAAEGYAACMRGETIRVPGLVNLVTTLSGRAMPRWVVRQIAGYVGRRAV